ncbi:MAG: phosphonate ABC transporter substrate-binding protein [Hyphomicrobium sp.]|nr:MAG: phosphonate ABC transporter substrate-binding protein [Hyphomicrobium sp.]
MFRKLVTATAMVASVAATATAVSAADELSFGIISTEASANLKTVWEPFLAEMEKGTGLKIKAFFASDYAGIIEAQRFNKVQIAWYGNKSAMEAVDRAEAEVFIQSVAKDGSPGYYSHLIVHKDSPIKSLDDVLKCDKSLDFGNGDPNSTSGFLVPMSYVFAAKNIDPKNCFKTVRAANHEANLLAVANKQVNIATNNNESLERLRVTKPESHAVLRVIWTSPLIPSDPLAWRKDLAAETKAKIYSFLMSYGRAGTEDELKKQREILAALGWAPFRPSSNDQLLPIRQLEASRKLLKIEGDDKIAAEDKKKQVEAVRAEIAKLEDAAKTAASSDLTKKVAAFVDADRAAKADEVKKLIGDFAAGFAKK